MSWPTLLYPTRDSARRDRLAERRRRHQDVSVVSPGRAALMRAPHPFGPHPLNADEKSVNYPVREGDGWCTVKVDADILPLMSAHRWRLVSGYPATTVYDVAAKKATHLQLHRLVTNAPAGVLVDHRRGNKLDARRCMLRFATYSQNSANRRASRRGRLSKYRGVTRHVGGRWQAQAKHKDKFVNGGLHDTEEAAALVYNKLAKAIWGRFAVLNHVRKHPRRRLAVQLELAALGARHNKGEAA